MKYDLNEKKKLKENLGQLYRKLIDDDIKFYKYFKNVNPAIYHSTFKSIVWSHTTAHNLQKTVAPQHKLS